MINYANEEIYFDGCPACAYGKHEFELPCGMAYEDDVFTLSQDWELPIDGLYIVSPKRHIEKLSGLYDEERNEMFSIVDKTIRILRENNVCNRFEVIFEERENRHFHVLIMPIHSWMIELVGDKFINLETIFNYAKNNFRNKKVYDRINTVTNIIRNNIQI